MAQAWYYPKPFSPIPRSLRPGESAEDDDDDDEEDDEEGIMKSVDYISGLVDAEVKVGKVAREKIVVGGFSQGCAISLLVGLMSRHAGRLGGVVGLSGYLPLAAKVAKSVEARGNSNGSTKFFLAHGSRDQLVPKRMFTVYREKVETWMGDAVESKMYEGLGHSTSGAEVRDLCTWLENVV